MKFELFELILVELTIQLNLFRTKLDSTNPSSFLISEEALEVEIVYIYESYPMSHSMPHLIELFLEVEVDLEMIEVS